MGSLIVDSVLEPPADHFSSAKLRGALTRSSDGSPLITAVWWTRSGFTPSRHSARSAFSPNGSANRTRLQRARASHRSILQPGEVSFYRIEEMILSASLTIRGLPQKSPENTVVSFTLSTTGSFLGSTSIFLFHQI